MMNYLPYLITLLLLGGGLRQSVSILTVPHTSTQVKKDTPLVRQIILIAKKTGCFEATKDSVCYELTPEGDFHATHFTVDTQQQHFQHHIPGKEAEELLQHLLDTPILSDFHITDQDKRDYIKLIDSLFGLPNAFLNKHLVSMNRQYYYSFPDKLKKIGEDALLKALEQPNTMLSTTNTVYSIYILLNDGETIEISNSTTSIPGPWLFSWEITRKNNKKALTSYSPHLTRFYYKHSPEKYPSRFWFNNPSLILHLANFSYQQ